MNLFSPNSTISWHSGLDEDVIVLRTPLEGSGDLSATATAPSISLRKKLTLLRFCFVRFLLLLCIMVAILSPCLETAILTFIFLMHLCFCETTEMQLEHKKRTIQAFPFLPYETRESELVCVVPMLPTGIAAPTILRKPKYTTEIPIVPERIAHGQRFEDFFELVEEMFDEDEDNIHRIVDAITDDGYGVLVPLECSIDVLQDALHFLPEAFLQNLFDLLEHEGDDDNDDVEPDDVEDADNAEPILPIVCVSEHQRQGAIPHFMKPVGRIQTEAWGIPFRPTLLPIDRRQPFRTSLVNVAYEPFGSLPPPAPQSGAVAIGDLNVAALCPTILGVLGNVSRATSCPAVRPGQMTLVKSEAAKLDIDAEVLTASEVAELDDDTASYCMTVEYVGSVWKRDRRYSNPVRRSARRTSVLTESEVAELDDDVFCDNFSSVPVGCLGSVWKRDRRYSNPVRRSARRTSVLTESEVAELDDDVFCDNFSSVPVGCLGSVWKRDRRYSNPVRRSARRTSVLTESEVAELDDDAL